MTTKRKKPTKAPAPARPLTKRELRFVEEYLLDLNATQAAVRAGYSKKTARSIGSENLSKPVIARAIVKAQESRATRTGITQDRVLHELEHLVFSNIKHYEVTKDDELVLAEGAPESAMAAVASFRRKPGEFGTEIEIKLWDKPGTLKLAGRHVGLFPDRLEVTGKNGKPIEVEAVRELPDDQLKQRVKALLDKL